LVINHKKSPLPLNMEEFINYLLRFGQLNPQQIDFIKSKVQFIDITKGSNFSEAGKIPRQVGFVVSGVLRICYYNNKHEDITRLFITENHFALDFNSFYSETPSAVYLEAVIDCKLLVLTKSSFSELSDSIIGFSDIFFRITSVSLTHKLKASTNMLTQDAKIRYEDFLTRYPGLANRIPLSTIASYLGITQSSLSRIRKNIS
jgi:CRP-like cAMP-binding protein